MEADVKGGSLQAAAVATGVGTALDVTGFNTAVFIVSGTFVGTVTFEGSTDGTTYFSISASPMAPGAPAATTTGTGLFRADVVGLARIRAEITAYASGNITVDARVVLEDSGDGITNVGGFSSISSATFARPGNTTAYAVNDVVSNDASTTTLMTFGNLARFASGNGFIFKANLTTDQKTCVAQMRLYLFTTLTPTVVGDNSPNALTWADRASRIGWVDFPALATDDTTSDCASALATSNTSSSNLPLPFGTAATSLALYGYLVTKTIFTPASGQNFYVKLSAGDD